jgi:6-phosphofructokinase 1
VIRTSRANPTSSAEDLGRTAASIRELGLTHLITIGGEDTASAAAAVASTGCVQRVAHIPKTIDNDLPLPANASTFGFQTARHLGTQWVLNLMEESRTTNRWCIVVVMGRKAGHLALGIGKAAGATVTVIPEEFQPEMITLDDICLVLEGAMVKRRVLGRRDGVAVVAEGVAARVDPEELARIPGVDVGHDSYGNIRLEKIPLAAILERELVRRAAARGESMPLVSVTLGYELRCAAPIPFDIDYTRTLGYGAVEYLLDAEVSEQTRTGGLVCLHEGRLEVLAFGDLREPDSGRIRTRLVDIGSEHYRVSREYMVRLRRADFDDAELLAQLAAEAGMDVAAFVERFRPMLERDAAEAA